VVAKATASGSTARASASVTGGTGHAFARASVNGGANTAMLAAGHIGHQVGMSGFSGARNSSFATGGRRR
jgi:hypothetical protein